MKTETVEIPTTVLSSVETLDELQDWLTAQNPKVIAELRAARRQELAGKFKPWKPAICHAEVEAGEKADAQFAGPDAAVGASVERKIHWLAENAAGMVQRCHRAAPHSNASKRQESM